MLAPDKGAVWSIITKNQEPSMTSDSVQSGWDKIGDTFFPQTYPSTLNDDKRNKTYLHISTKIIDNYEGMQIMLHCSSKRKQM